MRFRLCMLRELCAGAREAALVLLFALQVSKTSDAHRADQLKLPEEVPHVKPSVGVGVVDICHDSTSLVAIGKTSGSNMRFE